MIGLIDKQTRELYAIVNSIDGYNMAVFDQVDIAVDPRTHIWDVATETMTPRPIRTRERAKEALVGSNQWQAIRTATPVQIRSWLASNVTNLTEAREVLALLVLAVQALSARDR